MKKLFKYLTMALISVLAVSLIAYAGLRDRSSLVELLPNGDVSGAGNAIQGPQITAPTTNPPSNTAWLYVKDDGGTAKWYMETEAGVVTVLGVAATLTLDQAYTNGETIDLDTDGDLEMDLTVTARKVQIANTYAGAQAIALEIDAEVAQVITDAILFNATAGTITDAIDAKHASITNAINVGDNVILGAAASIDFTEFDVASGTGSVTIADGGGAGFLSVDSTVLDKNSLDFNAEGDIISGATAAIRILPDDGATAGEDFLVTAHNIQITAGGAITISPDGAPATALAIDATDADLTNALSVGANAILGTTGIIDYTAFDVDAAGGVICTALDAGAGTIETLGDITVGGTLTTGTVAQDAIMAVTPNTSLDLDGSAGAAGGVDIGTLGGAGAIVMGAAGHSIAVNLAATVDLTLAQGDLSITDVADTDLVTLVNDTMTTADIIDISAGGTRTGGGVIKIVDAATTASTITIVADAATTGNIIAVQADALEAGGAMLYLDSDAIPDTNTFYIECVGTGTDYTLAQDGTAVHSGIASADVITLTLGDLQISAGDIDVDIGKVEIDTTDATDFNYMKMTTNTDVAADSAYLTVETTDTDCAAENYLLRLRHFADGDAQDNFLVLEDNNADDIFDIRAGGETIWNLDDFTILINADTVAQTGITGTINMDVRSATAAHVGFLMDYELDDGGSATQYGFQVSLDDDGAGGNELFIAYDALISAGVDAAVTGFQATNYDTALKTTSTAAQVILDVDVATAYTAKGFDIDLGDHVGTADEGFIDIFTDADTTDVLGQILRIDLQDTTVETLAISGKAIYAKEVSAYKLDEFLVHLESTSNGSLICIGETDFTAAPLRGASPLILDGATPDATNRVTLTVTDPTSATSLNIPDAPAGGELQTVVSVGTTQTVQAGAGTSTVTGSSIAIPNGHAAAGHLYTWEVSGSKTGANVAFIVHLKLNATQQMSMTSPDALAVDWIARFKMFMTAAGTQHLSGELHCAGKVSAITSDITSAVDLSGAVNVFVEIQSQNAGDAVNAETVLVTYNE